MAHAKNSELVIRVTDPKSVHLSARKDSNLSVQGQIPRDNKHVSMVGHVEVRTRLECWLRKRSTTQEAHRAGKVPAATDFDKNKKAFEGVDHYVWLPEVITIFDQALTESVKGRDFQVGSMVEKTIIVTMEIRAIEAQDRPVRATVSSAIRSVIGNTVKPPSMDAVGGTKVHSCLLDYLYQWLRTALIKIYLKNCVIVICWVDIFLLKSQLALHTLYPLYYFTGNLQFAYMTWAEPNMRNLLPRDRDGVQSLSEKSLSLLSSASSLTINSTESFSIMGSVKSSCDWWLKRFYICVRSSETVTTRLIPTPSVASSSLASRSIDEAGVSLTNLVCFQQLMITFSVNSFHACRIRRIFWKTSIL